MATISVVSVSVNVYIIVIVVVIVIVIVIVFLIVMVIVMRRSVSAQKSQYKHPRHSCYWSGMSIPVRNCGPQRGPKYNPSLPQLRSQSDMKTIPHLIVVLPSQSTPPPHAVH